MCLKALKYLYQISLSLTLTTGRKQSCLATQQLVIIDCADGRTTFPLQSIRLLPQICTVWVLWIDENFLYANKLWNLVFMILFKAQFRALQLNNYHSMLKYLAYEHGKFLACPHGDYRIQDQHKKLHMSWVPNICHELDFKEVHFINQV